MTITRDDEILGGEPRIDGTRIGVRHVAESVIDGEYSPAHAADQLDLSLAQVYEALAYYYDNLEELRELEREHGTAVERLRDGSLKPKEPIS